MQTGCSGAGVPGGDADSGVAAIAGGVHAEECRREAVHLCSVGDALIRGWQLGALVETP